MRLNELFQGSDKAAKDSTLQNKYPLGLGREGEKWKEQAETQENWVQIQALLHSAYPCLCWSFLPWFSRVVKWDLQSGYEELLIKITHWI